MKRRCQFSIPAVAEPKSASSRRSPPTTVRRPGYVFAEDRKAMRARQLLGDYHGILQVDGYAAYKGLIKNGGRLVQVAF